MRKPFNAALVSAMLVLTSGVAFAAQTTTPKPNATVIKEDRARIKADRAKLKADTKAGNTAAVQQDKAQLKTDMEKLRADGGGKKHGNHKTADATKA
jgi:cytochrome c556